MARHAFVTGGTGFVGRTLIERLRAAGWQVGALCRPGADFAPLVALDVALVAGDILDPASLREGLPSAVDAVFHVAADTSHWRGDKARQTRVNIDGTRNVVAACLEAGVGRLIHTSTWNVYDLHAGAIHEDLPRAGARSWRNYDRTKAAAEDIVRQGIAEGLDAVILNPAHILGRYDRKGWARMFSIVQADKLVSAPPGAGSFVHAGAVADAHIAAVDKGRPGQNYLLGGIDAEFVNLLQIIGDLVERRVPDKTLPPWLLMGLAHIMNGYSMLSRREPDLTPEAVETVCARPRIVSDKAIRELGHDDSVPLSAMLRESHAWLLQEGLLPPN